MHDCNRGEGHDAPLEHERSERLLPHPRRVLIDALDVRTSRVRTRRQRRERQRKVRQLLRRPIPEKPDVPVVLLNKGVYVR